MSLPVAPYTGQAAIDVARSRVGGTMPASGYCLQFTRECYGVPAVYGSAIDAARACNAPHPYDWNPEPGTPIYFWTSSQYDHVCVYIGPNEVISTFNEEIRSFNGISSIEANFGGTYAGWGEDLNEYQVYVPSTTPPTPEPPPEQEDDDMPWFIRRTDGLICVVGPTGVRSLTAMQWEIYGNLGWQTKMPPEMSNLDVGPFNELVASLGGIVE